MLTSGLEVDSDKLKEALANMTKVWEDAFAQISEEIRDKPLAKEILWNPDHQITNMLLYLYTLDNMLFQELNKGSREGDKAKIDTLGPYAAALAKIFAGAAIERTDISELKNRIEN